MDADFSIELGHDDPALDFPWRDPTGQLVYVDLKRHPEFISQIEEAVKFPELAEFLKATNWEPNVFASAKCDVWTTTELSAEEDVFAASHKFSIYVDLVFSDMARRISLPLHESFARALVELLRRAPEIAAAAEFCIRRCFFRKGNETEEISEGFYFTVYVNGYGDDEVNAQKNWVIAMKLVENAIWQLSARLEAATSSGLSL